MNTCFLFVTLVSKNKIAAQSGSYYNARDDVEFISGVIHKQWSKSYMSEEMLVVSATALFVMFPIILGELLDRLFKVSWKLIKKLG